MEFTQAHQQMIVFSMRALHAYQNNIISAKERTKLRLIENSG